MRTLRFAAVVAVLTLGAQSLVTGQAGSDLFQRALAKERAEGQLAEAIQIYERIVKEYRTDRPLVAKALLQLGVCYEKLGNDGARKAYEQLVREFSDQQASAASARARLAKLDRAAASAAGTRASRRVWSGPDVDLEGAVSADGRYLTFVDWETGDVAIRDLATGVKRRLTKNPPFQRAAGFANASAPSPDGRSIAYVWFSYATDIFELRVIGADGTGDRAVYSKSHEYVLRVAWLPSGRELAIVYQRADRMHQLAVVALADGALRPLRTFDWRRPERISVAPDGRYIAYDFPPKEDSASRDVFIQATDGSQAGTLIEHSGDDLSPLWTPDGRRVVFVSDRSGGAALWSVAVDSGKATEAPRLLQPIGNAVPLGFTRSGSLYYGLFTAAVDVYTAEINPVDGRVAREPRQVHARVVGANQRPHWSSDGRWLAYQSDRALGPTLASNRGQGTRVLAVLSMDTGVERELSPALTSFQRPRWSPDRRTLLVSARSTASRRGLYAVDVETGTPTPLVLVENEAAAFGHTWSPDGSTVFFTTSDARGAFIGARDVKSAETRELYRPPPDGAAGDASVSPDGSWVAFREWSGRSLLKVIPAGGGTAREVVRIEPPDDIPAFGGINWTRDGQWLLFVRAGGPMQQRRQLWRVPSAGGTPERLELSMRGLRDVSLHPDGRQIAFTASEGDDEVWLLENLLESVLPRTAGSGRGVRR